MTIEQDGLARVVLARPEVANAVDLALARSLMEATRSMRWDDRVRAVLIEGEGERFCGGGDLRSFSRRGEHLSEHLADVTTYLHAAVSCLTRASVPVVAAVQGTAAGAGLSLALSADVVLVGASARLTTAYAGVGLSPDGSLSYVLPALVGQRRALELLLTNRVLSAEEAVEWGLATRVVADDALHEDAARVARELANGPTRALGAAKRLVRASRGRSLEGHLAAESEILAETARTEDAREGIAAFLEKRTAHFEGR